CAATCRSPLPESQALSTSRISVTATSRNAIPRTPKSIDLEAPGTGSDQDPQAGTPGGPITGNRVVPCSWQKTPQGGPMLLAGDTPPIWAGGFLRTNGPVSAHIERYGVTGDP